MTDKRIEFIRAYLKSNLVWDREESDLAYLIKELDAANQRIAELEIPHNIGSNADLEQKYYDNIDAHDKLAGDI